MSYAKQHLEEATRVMAGLDTTAIDRIVELRSIFERERVGCFSWALVAARPTVPMQ